MPQPITTMRIGMLAELGEDEFVRLYLQHRTLLKTLMAIYGHPDKYEHVDVHPFYKWLDAVPGRREWWDEVKKMRGELDAEEAVDMVLDANAATIHVAEKKARSLQWRAGKVNAQYSDRAQINNTTNHVTVGDAWLKGMLEASQQREPLTLEAKVEDDEG